MEVNYCDQCNRRPKIKGYGACDKCIGIIMSRANLCGNFCGRSTICGTPLCDTCFLNRQKQAIQNEQVGLCTICYYRAHVFGYGMCKPCFDITVDRLKRSR